MATTKVFISYAHETEELSSTVLDLSNHLRDQGIDSEIDQYEEAPPEGWPKWMMRQVQEADYVLVMCSKLFFDRANDFSRKQEGLGVKWETTLILQQLYSMNTGNTKFIPVISENNAAKFIPLPLQPYTYYNIGNIQDKEKLVNRLLGISKSKRPELGVPSVPKPLPPKSRKTLFVTSIINLDLWNKAGWNSMAFMTDPSLTNPPIVGFIFNDGKAGDQIFSELKDRFGNKDEKEEIRLSFIEKSSDAHPHYYKVHLGTDWSVFREKLEQNNIDPDSSYVMGLSRIHQMTPQPDSKNLAIFKHAYAYFKRYLITNCSVENGRPKPNFDNAIEKSRVYFRTKSDVISDRNDPDHVVVSDVDWVEE